MPVREGNFMVDKRIRSMRCLVGFMVFIAWMGLTAPVKAVGLDNAGEPKIFEHQEAFLSRLYDTVVSRSAALIFDYYSRPVIGTVVFDFNDPSGKEVALGRLIAAYLRAGLNQEKQFFVFSREQIKNSLGLFIQSDGDLKPSSLKWLQENAPQLLNTPIHLLITGRIEKESESGIRITVTLIPFYKLLNPVEVESGGGSYPQLVFTSPILSSSEMAASLAPPTPPMPFSAGRIQNQGRLLILSNLAVERITERESKYLRLLNQSDRKEKSLQAKRQWELGSVEDLSCWLNGQELFIFKRDQLEAQKEFYYNIMSGFNAGQIWFDGEIPEGEHRISFSLFPFNKLYKKVLSHPFKIKKGATTYLVIQVRSFLEAEPGLSIREVIDPQNKINPFTK